MKYYFFRSEDEKRFDTACNLLQYSNEAPIPDLHDLERRTSVTNKRLNTRVRRMLSRCYEVAAHERVSRLRLSPIGFGPSETFLSILPAVGAVRQSELDYLEAMENNLPKDDPTRRSDDLKARDMLDQALGGAWSMYNSATFYGEGRGYSGRADLYRSVADTALMQQGVQPTHLAPRNDASELADKEVVQVGQAILGFRVMPYKPALEFGDEILWLYEQAKEDYEIALRIDSTDARVCLGLSHILRELELPDEADAQVHKALVVLNRAIEADPADGRSYSERAEVFEELGEVEPAIADLQRFLSVATTEYETTRAMGRLEKLRKTALPDSAATD